MATLHVYKVTQRVLKARSIQWHRFHKALIQLFTGKLRQDFLAGVNHKFWHDELDKYNGGARHNLHPATLKAAEWCLRFPMGH